MTALAAILLGCASRQSADAGPKATLLGSDTSGARVLIKSVDDGPLLWAHPGALGSRVSITPGHHKVVVMCEFGAHFVDGALTLDVQPGETYDLAASQAEGTGGCNVSASKRG